ncbi:MaoC/PaaZ C-terminal domain-containing protein [Saccharomonospora sp. NPDC046836]|uniref:MaoC/PaaZ C-terminal domain-containing protein n=1 Tax=Saccharomonospora sp. NPDC046836 TaxID=3156921 RepID=UPI0034039BD5
MLRPSLYFEDFEVGQQFVTPARTIGEAEIATFAGLSGDFNPIHTDAAFASNTPFGQRLAHGLLGLSVMTGLSNRLGLWESCTVALLGIEEWRFIQPIFAGDTVHATIEITETRATRDGLRGVIGRRYSLVNQRDATVQQGSLPLMVTRRP